MKDKLWKKCGTSVNSMQLELYDDANYKISDLTDDSRPLGFYSPLDGLVILFNLLILSFLPCCSKVMFLACSGVFLLGSYACNIASRNVLLYVCSSLLYHPTYHSSFFSLS